MFLFLFFFNLTCSYSCSKTCSKKNDEINFFLDKLDYMHSRCKYYVVAVQVCLQAGRQNRSIIHQTCEQNAVS